MWQKNELEVTYCFVCHLVVEWTPQLHLQSTSQMEARQGTNRMTLSTLDDNLHKLANIRMLAG